MMSMSKMIQIRDVPDPMHAILTARAAKAGMSLSDYLLVELRSIAEIPTLEETLVRLAKRGPIHLPGNTADLIREEREARGRHLERLASSGRPRQARRRG